MSNNNQCLPCGGTGSAYEGTSPYDEIKCNACGGTGTQPSDSYNHETLEGPLRRNIGMLRQWLNEDRIKEAKYFVTNEDLEHWLFWESNQDKDAL